MNHQFPIFASNCQEALFSHLNELLFSDSDPYQRRCVVVPNISWKGWLQRKLVEVRGIACGVEIVLLENFFYKGLAFQGGELALHIEQELLKGYHEWESVHRYLAPEGKIREKRVTDLSFELAKLFKQYAIYGGAWLEKSTQEEHWQWEIWKRLNLSSEVYIPEYPVHLFCVSFLPNQLLKELQKGSLSLLTPTSTFWSDLISDRQKVFAPKNMEPFFETKHRFLSNCGRLGIEMAKQIDEVEGTLSDAFVISTKKRLTLLDAIKNDWLLFESNDSKVDLEDAAIEVHVSHSKRREMQAIYTLIVDLLKKDPTLKSSDISVMMPDVSEYEPWIHAIFNTEENGVVANILDLPMLIQSPRVQAFSLSLELITSRFEASRLLRLFEQPSFYLKQKWKWKDLLQIREWINRFGIVWGEDGAHRSALLKSDHDIDENILESNVGTWDEGMQRMLKTLLSPSSDERASLDISMMDLFQEVFTVQRDLRKVLSQFSDGEKRPLKEWAVMLLEFLHSYFLTGDDPLEKTLEDFSVSDLRDELFSFQTILEHIQRAFLKRRCRDHPLQRGVRFSALQLMHTTSSRVVILMGLNSDSFPRIHPRSSLNLMERKADFCPTLTDSDRYSFLEACLAANEKLVMSYSSQEGSSIIDEFLQELDSYYTINGKAPSEECLVAHPIHSYDEKNHYSAFYHTIAKAKRGELEPEKRMVRLETSDAKEEIIHLDSLTSFAKHPIRYFLNNHLGIYLKSEEKRKVIEREPLHLDPKWRGWILRQAIDGSIEEAWDAAKHKGVIPEGKMGEIAYEKLTSQLAELAPATKSLSMTFSRKYEEKKFVEGVGWQMPPIVIKENTLLEGSIPYSDSEPLCHYGKGEGSELIELYPQILLNQLFNGKQELFFLKSNKEMTLQGSNVVEKLSSYLDFFIDSKMMMSWLMPNWLEAIIGRDPKRLQECIQQDLGEGMFSYRDDYVHWVYQKIDPVEIIDTSAEKAEILFSHLFEKGAK